MPKVVCKIKFGETVEVRPSDIKEWVFQRKVEDTDALYQLAENIKTSGMIEPVIVEKISNGYRGIAGFRRWKAAQIAGLEKIPARVFQGNTVGAMKILISENEHREELGIADMARALKMFIEATGLKGQRLAKELNMSKGRISQILAFFKEPEEVQKAAEEKKISERQFREVRKLKNVEKKVEVIKKAKTSKEIAEEAAKEKEKEEQERLQRELEARAKRLQARIEHIQAKQASLADLRKEVADLDKEIAKLERQLKKYKLPAKDAEEAVQKINKLHKKRQRVLERLAKKKSELENISTTEDFNPVKAAEELQEKQKKLEEVKKQADEIRAQIEKLKKKLSDLSSVEKVLEAEVKELSKNIEAYNSAKKKKAELEQEIQKLKEEQVNVESDIAHAEREFKKTYNVKSVNYYEKTKAERQKIVERLSTLMNLRATKQGQITKIENEIAQLVELQKELDEVRAALAVNGNTAKEAEA